MKLWVDRDCSLPLVGLQIITADQFPLKECSDIYFQAQSYDDCSVILRYAILQNEGGVYIDHDAQCLASLEPLRAAHDFFCDASCGSPQKSDPPPAAALHYPLPATMGYQPLLRAEERRERRGADEMAGGFIEELQHRKAPALL